MLIERTQVPVVPRRPVLVRPVPVFQMCVNSVKEQTRALALRVVIQPVRPITGVVHQVYRVLRVQRHLPQAVSFHHQRHHRPPPATANSPVPFLTPKRFARTIPVEWERSLMRQRLLKNVPVPDLRRPRRSEQSAKTVRAETAGRSCVTVQPL